MKPLGWLATAAAAWAAYRLFVAKPARPGETFRQHFVRAVVYEGSGSAL